MENVIKYFIENAEELQQILDGKASFAQNFDAAEVLKIVSGVMENAIVPMASYWS